MYTIGYSQLHPNRKLTSEARKLSIYRVCYDTPVPPVTAHIQFQTQQHTVEHLLVGE